MRRPLKILLMTGCMLALSIMIATLAGIRINTTRSYQRGIYLMTNDPIEKGALVIFCPADTSAFRQARERGYIGAGFCPGGYGYMIKKIMAAKGDHVEMAASGVYVNGKLLPNSKPADNDAEGQPLPHTQIKTVLDEHTVLLMSDYSPKSFDARYFGLIDKKNVISSVKLVWVF